MSAIAFRVVVAGQVSRCLSGFVGERFESPRRFERIDWNWREASVAQKSEDLGKFSNSHKRHLLTNLILSLHTVIKQKISLLKLQIKQAPEPPQKFIKGLVWDTSPETRQALLSCEESLVAILEGIRAIGTAALALEEPKFAWSIVAALLRNLEDSVPLDRAQMLARRILPRENDPWPELPWTNALEVIPQSRAVVEAKLSELDEQGPEYLELELKEEELEALAVSAA